MTDTTPEAVERLARVLDGPFYRVEGYAGPYIDEATLRDEHTAAAATLRAQQARIDAMRDDIITLGAQVGSLMRERDDALAQVAGAYEAAARVTSSHAKYTREAIKTATAAALVTNLITINETRTAHFIEDKIRALAPADATAALDRIKRQARAEGMREAAKIARLKASGEPVSWKSIANAPYDTPLTVRVGGMTFGAILRRGVSETTDGDPCDQWQALIEDEHPPCWTDGACWEINADGYGSREPEAWRTIAAQTPPEGAAHKAILAAAEQEERGDE